MALNKDVTTGTKNIGKGLRGTKGLSNILERTSNIPDKTEERAEAPIKNEPVQFKPKQTIPVNKVPENQKKPSPVVKKETPEVKSTPSKRPDGKVVSMVYLPKENCDYLMERSAYEGFGISDMVNELVHQEHARMKGKRLAELKPETDVLNLINTAGARVSKSVIFDEESIRFIEQMRKQFVMKRSAYVGYIIAKERLHHPNYKLYDEIVE